MYVFQQDRKVPSGIMTEKNKIKWVFKKPLNPQESEEIANRILSEDLPLDNNLLTDEEESDSEDGEFDSQMLLLIFPDLQNNLFRELQIW